MEMQELREAFAAWELGELNSEAIVRALADPTPITEAGLRELGFEGSVETQFYVGWLRGWFDEDGQFFFYNCKQYPKTMGRLRCLLLGLGE